MKWRPYDSAENSSCNESAESDTEDQILNHTGELQRDKNMANDSQTLSHINLFTVSLQVIRSNLRTSLRPILPKKKGNKKQE